MEGFGGKLTLHKRRNFTTVPSSTPTVNRYFTSSGGNTDRDVTQEQKPIIPLYHNKMS